MLASIVHPVPKWCSKSTKLCPLSYCVIFMQKWIEEWRVILAQFLFGMALRAPVGPKNTLAQCAWAICTETIKRHVKLKEWKCKSLAAESCRWQVAQLTLWFEADKGVNVWAELIAAVACRVSKDLNLYACKGLFINDVIIFGGFHFRAPMYWEYNVYMLLIKRGPKY